MKKFTVTIEGANWKDIQELELLDLPKEGDTVETRYGTCIVTEAELNPDSGERAGKILERLPDANQRRNFWTSARASSMTQDEISRVVCFMAAGVVAQNPKSFGINSQSLSSRVK